MAQDAEHLALKQFALDEGDADALAYLAQCHVTGDHGESLDLDLARELFHKAAEQGHENAKQSLDELDHLCSKRRRIEPQEEKAIKQETSNHMELKANADRLFEVVDGLMYRAQSLLNKLQTPGLDIEFVKVMKTQHDEILSHCMKLLHTTTMQL